MVTHQLALRLGFITCLSAVVVLRPDLSLASSNQIERVNPSLLPAEVSQGKQNTRPIPPSSQQQERVDTYTQQELQQLLLVLKGIQQLQVRPQQTQQLQSLIQDLEQLKAQGQPEVVLTPQQSQQVQTLIGSLTPEEIERLDQALKLPPVEVGLFSQQELQELLSILKGIQQLGLRPQQTRPLQSLIQELEQLQAQGRAEVLLTPQQTQQVQTLVDSLTPEEVERLNQVVKLPAGITDRWSQDALKELISFLQTIQKLGIRPQQTQEIQSLIGELEDLQAQGEPVVVLTPKQTQQVQTLLDSLTPEEVAQLEQALPQTGEARRLTQEQVNEVLALLRAAQEVDLEPEQAEQVKKNIQVLETLQAQGQPDVILSGEQVQELQALYESFTQVQLRQLARTLGIAGSSPSISILTPVGFGGYWRTASIGANFQQRTRFTQTSDASIGATVSFGNPEKYVGVDASFSIFGLSNESGEEDNAGTGSVSVQVSRLLPNNFSVGLGVENLLEFGSGTNDAGNSTYLVVSKILVLNQDFKKPLNLAFISLGLGNGRFRLEEDFDRDDNGTVPNLFGSLAGQLNDQVNAIIEWTGQDLTMGLSLVPFKRFPLVITPALVDLTGSAGDGVRLNVGIGYSITF